MQIKLQMPEDHYENQDHPVCSLYQENWYLGMAEGQYSLYRRFLER